MPLRFYFCWRCLSKQALANLAPAPPFYVGFQVLLIFPLIILCTEIGGGYPILKSFRDNTWQKHFKSLTGICGPLMAVFAVFLASLVPGLGYILLLICAILALMRGFRMIGWGFLAAGKSRAAKLHMENSSPLRLKLAGCLLVVFTLALVIHPLTFSPYEPRGRAYDSDAKSNLHNVYLGCKAYWADNGSGADCTVDIVLGTTYGYVQSREVTITASGNEAHFSALVRHSKSELTFAMDRNGDIGNSSVSLPIRKVPEKSWFEKLAGNIEANLSFLGF